MCGESTAHWRIPWQTINSAELCCLINAFRIAGGMLMFDERFPHCWPSVWCLHLFQSSSQKNRSFGVFFHVCPSELLNKQWRCKWVENSWNSDNVICHSVINDIIVPLCGETIGHQWIPVARDHWSLTLVVQCAAIPSPVESSHKSSAWCFLLCLPYQAV